MKTAETYYKAEIRSIDAWGNKREGYEYNATYLLEDGLVFSEHRLTTRKILKALRKWEFLGSKSQGMFGIDDQWPFIEIKRLSDDMPVLLLLFNEEGIQ